MIHKHKYWFYCGIGLFTMIWVPNFKPKPDDIQFFPYWISFPFLPLEYRDPQIIEILENKLGIFLKHDLIPYDHPHLDVRVCLLLSMHKPFPTSISINSQWGLWEKPVKVQDSQLVQKFQTSLGHFKTQCQKSVQGLQEVCSDHSTDPNLCVYKDCKDTGPKEIVLGHTNLEICNQSTVRQLNFSQWVKILLQHLLGKQDFIVSLPYKIPLHNMFSLHSETQLLREELPFVCNSRNKFIDNHQYVEWKLQHIGDQIVTMIATNIIYDIAEEEGLHEDNQISTTIDDLLKDFWHWNSHLLQRHPIIVNF